MTPERGEAGGVEPRTYLRGVVAVQLEELDPVVAELADAPQRACEVAVALLADRPEL